MEQKIAPEELTGVPLFSDLRPEDLVILTRQARLEGCPPRKRLFREGEKPEALYVLLSGSVQLSATTTRDSREAIIEIVGAPDTFVLAAALTDSPYLMSATVLEPARLLLLPAAVLRQDIADRPELAMTLLASLAAQSRRMVRQLKNLKLRSTVQRLGWFLLNLAEPAANDTAVVTLPYDKQLIASQLGMTRESLSRALASLRAYGVETQGNRVLLKDPTALAAYCNASKSMGGA